jgi:2,4-dienoyl-CoA reductase-like NADH-dependent reductase (Old Yellow Enzyme family)
MSLFSPYKIREIQLRNRIAVSPMCQYSSEDGFVNDWHLVHLGALAVGGSGLVVTEAAAVRSDGRISPQDLGIYEDAHIAGLARLTKFIKEHGAVPAIQLAHAGRKASMHRPWEAHGYVSESDGGWSRVVGPSPIAFGDGYLTPVELNVDEIDAIIEAFAEATRRALQAGFEIIEIHGAHGYLIHEFLSPISNLRTDEFGGSFENRTRFVKRLVDRVREVWPATLPLFVRLSASDWTEGGWDIDQTVQLSKELHAAGVDLIDCSSGGNVAGANIPLTPGYQVPFAAAVRSAGVPSSAVGLITESKQADEIIGSGQADLVMLARELLRDPHWPLKAAKELGVDVEWPEQYARAK